MAIKIFCDKSDCNEEIDQSQGGGTFVLMIRETTLDQQAKQMVPRLRQQEFQVCMKHAQEIVDFLKKEKVEQK